ncbi:flagellar assembly protein FliH [Enterovirga aerilata]|uniref:Flagellar assembly protein FliH n=1 Tax=Enterovirga aerilata TaxID=2730920 RepID=A0A849IBW0_9HYPH|nr:flagellar assembly protein FliH [Enterovirga sp. DB1703]NNM73530.1 flagellar assembly protein FliH [Enterovirga sp. DB1703]
MSTARKFLFGDDLRGPSAEEVAAREAADRAARDEALRRAFADGVEEGRRQAAAETERRLALAMERLAAEASARFAALDIAVTHIEDEALAYFEALARKLAGSALAAQPLAAVADAGAAAFRHLRGVPHLVARVGAPLVEDAEAMLRRIGREHGFEGRIIVIGDEDFGPGDVRLEWADGGVARDRAAFDRAIDAALAAASAAPADQRHENGPAMP